MKKYGLVNTRNDLWIPVAEKLKSDNVATPLIFFYSVIPYNEFNKIFPDCLTSFVLDMNNWCKGNFENITFTSDEIVLPDNWAEIKDVIKLIFNRYNALGEWRNLDMDASIMNIFVNLSRIWPKEKLDLFIFTETPHTPVDYMIYKLCQVKKIPTLMLQQHNIVPVTMFKWDIDGKTIKLSKDRFEAFYYTKVVNKIQSHFDLIKANEKHEPDYVKALNKINDNRFTYAINRSKLIFIEIWGVVKKKRVSRSVFRSFETLGARPLDPLRAGLINLKIRKQLEKSFLDKFDVEFPDENYLFFPLHYEPERTTVPDGGKYYDQLKAIVKLREKLDKSIPILVKEHFLTFSMAMQGHHGRSSYFYDVIKALPNTYLIDYRLNTRKLLKNATWVATISGTTLYEAVALGTPAIMFGNSWFEQAPGFYKFDNLNQDDFKQLYCNSDDMVAFLIDQIKKFSIPGAAHQSSVNNLKLFYGDLYTLEKESNIMFDTLIELMGNIPKV